MRKYKFCFLFGPGRCGINLFFSLLDNHKEVVVLPFTIKFYEIFKKKKYYLDYESLIEIIEKKTKFRILKKGKRHMDYSNKKLHDYSFYNHSIFREELKKNILKKGFFTRKKLIEIIMLSYAKAIKKNIKKVKYIFIDATYGDYLDKINFDFKKYKSICLLRDPREQLLSLSKHFHDDNLSLYIHRKKNYLVHSILSQKECYNLLEKLRKKNYDNLLIKYENLTIHTKKNMQKVSRFLDIDFNKTLLKPTIFGKSSLAVSSFSKKPISGVSKKTTDRLQKYLTKNQIIQADYIFRNYIDSFDYYKINYKNNFLTKLLIYFQPFKYEIVPSLNIFKTKKNIFFMLAKFTYYYLNNIFCFLVGRFFNFSYMGLFKKDRKFSFVLKNYRNIS